MFLYESKKGHACLCTAPPHQVVSHSHQIGLLLEQAGRPQRPLLVAVQTCKEFPCVKHSLNTCEKTCTSTSCIKSLLHTEAHQSTIFAS